MKKDWELCEDPDGCVACLIDNRDRVDYEQRSDVDVQSEIDAGETILSLFLGIPKCRITSIIKVKSGTRKNSTYAQASRTAKEYADCRVTRQLRASNLGDSLPNTMILTATKIVCSVEKEVLERSRPKSTRCVRYSTGQRCAVIYCFDR